ncbi:MAG TPA: hypothetical protein VJZ93_04075 [Candidatus Nanoarchaeia archaeon]|nr:hypothetical protein [Candidatus Nanoarchaeia archaeon]
MVKIILESSTAKLLISEREIKREPRGETFDYLERKIQNGNWDELPPIWVTPNFLLNGFFNEVYPGIWGPTIKPFIMYNGHHRLRKAVEHNLPISIIIRFTPGNPRMPEEERLRAYDGVFDFE